ncbi:MAG: DsbA family oxidoreductase [Pseudomonadota bacterium]
MTHQHRPIQIDIVSDVVCPWCIIGFKQLEQALDRVDVTARLRWHPFELNPDMPEQGRNLHDHIIGKYGSTAEQNEIMRARLTELGDQLGFSFRFSDESRMFNTFGAHLLLDWAAEHHCQHKLKLALFSAYFTDGLDVSDTTVLTDIAEQVGLDPIAAKQVLVSGERAQSVRRKQQFWTSRGVSGVPTMVFDRKYLVTGAQGVEQYVELLRRCRADAA